MVTGDEVVGPYQTSMRELVVKILNELFLQKGLIIDVW